MRTIERESKFCAIGRTESLITKFDGTDEQNEGWGIIFDFVAKVDIVIHGLDLNIEKKTSTEIAVFIRDGTHYGQESNSSSWNNLGLFSIITNGEGNPTQLMFEEGILTRRGIHSFFLTQKNRDDIKYYDRSSVGFGAIDVSNRYLSILVGTGKRDLRKRPGDPFTSENIRGKGFSGSINYSVCKHDEIPTNAPMTLPPTTEPTYTPIPSSIPSTILLVSPSSNKPLKIPSPSIISRNSATTILATPECVDAELSSKSAEFPTEVQGSGILFNIVASGMNDIFLNGFNIKIGEGKNRLSVYTRTGNFKTFTNNYDWVFLGDYSVKRKGPDELARLDLTSSISLVSGTIQAMKIILQDSRKMDYFHFDDNMGGEWNVGDDYISLTLGSDPFKQDNDYWIGFSGSIKYSICTSELSRSVFNPRLKTRTDLPDYAGAVTESESKYFILKILGTFLGGCVLSALITLFIKKNRQKKIINVENDSVLPTMSMTTHKAKCDPPTKMNCINEASNAHGDQEKRVPQRECKYLDDAFDVLSSLSDAEDIFLTKHFSTSASVNEYDELEFW